MKRMYWLGLWAILAANQVLAQMDGVYFDGGVKAWYAEPKVTDRALMYGPSAAISVGDQYWVRGYYLYGQYDYVRSVAPRRVQGFGIHDAELVAGMNWDVFHFGFGLRSMTVLIEEDGDPAPIVRRPNALGPVLAAGASQSFAEWPWGFEGSPWGWFGGVTWMFSDLESNDGEHLNLEAGITHVSQGLYKRLGYRYKETFDHEPMEGFIATLMFAF
jgi:hypothetical protein